MSSAPRSRNRSIMRRVGQNPASDSLGRDDGSFCCAAAMPLAVSTTAAMINLEMNPDDCFIDNSSVANMTHNGFSTTFVLALLDLTPQRLIGMIVLFPLIALCLTVHEFWHAYSADLMGDPTGRLQGRC